MNNTQADFAKGCPSTHCNRREECASPNDCIRTERIRADGNVCAGCGGSGKGSAVFPIDGELSYPTCGRCFGSGKAVTP